MWPEWSKMTFGTNFGKPSALRQQVSSTFGNFGTNFGAVCRSLKANKHKGFLIFLDTFGNFGNIYRNGHKTSQTDVLCTNMPKRRSGGFAL